MRRPVTIDPPVMDAIPVAMDPPLVMDPPAQYDNENIART